jgi:hypothetical protein
LQSSCKGKCDGEEFKLRKQIPSIFVSNMRATTELNSIDKKRKKNLIKSFPILEQFETIPANN